MDRKICVGMIAGAHGVRGLVRLRSFLEDPETIVDYEPLTDEGGEKTYVFDLKATAKDFFIAAVDGVQSREAAEALQGTKLYVSRQLLPKTGKREYYEADLVGLAVQDQQARSHGTVLAIHNYGAGVFLEIGVRKNAGFMLPFTDAYVPLIDIKTGVVTIDPPEGWVEVEKPQKIPPKSRPSVPKKGGKNA